MTLNKQPQFAAFTYLQVMIFLSICIFGGKIYAQTHAEIVAEGSKMKPPVKAPFKGVDKLATNDWWNRKPSDIINLKVHRDSVIAFGLYTVSEGTLKLSAQLFPLYPNESREVRLELWQDGKWAEVQRQKVDDLGWSALFRIDNWNDQADARYRLRHGQKASYEGIIRKNPSNQDEFVIAALSCNSKKDRGDRANFVRNIKHQNPDLIFFAGDQSYDHREHTAAWLKFGMQFRETFRNRPCISIPDDHDVGMYNIWGEGGKEAKSMMGFRGGYRFHPEYVKMVERCQTANLPDPYDPSPIKQGIGVYYCRLLWGGMDFAIIEDRKFKSGPKGKVPAHGIIRHDIVKKLDYDTERLDVEGLKLLGERQLAFLEDWGKEQQQPKVVLSQTAFFSGPEVHGKRQIRTKADLDSNGWPQTGRDKALKAIQKAKAIHIAGDQHIAFVVQQGIDEYDDGPLEFTVPAVVNSIYERWWWPQKYADQEPRVEQDSLAWTGPFQDGFGNKFTMLAYANPNASSNGAGYGLIRIHKSKREVVFECWPRFVDVQKGDAKQFVGWPVVKTF